MISTEKVEINNEKFIQLEVQDNGTGFNEKEINKVFEPYVTSKPKGKGLGLAIVKSIVDEHQGQIKIETNKTGARVRIRLPVAYSAEENL